MKTIKQILYIYTETPMHTGTGTGLGAVDMPIQREKHTNYPVIQASGVKGALRDTVELFIRADKTKSKTQQDDEIITIFGAASGNPDEDFAGAMSPSDARILLFPVRALNGVFVWITSPTVLERFKRDIGISDTYPPLEFDKENPVVLVSDENLIIRGQVMLEEYTYQAAVSPVATDWASYLAENALHGEDQDFWKIRLSTHLIILPDNEFRDFVTYATDIVTRIHIDDVKKTVKDGQLFTQELLPADSLLYSVVQITDSRKQIKDAGTEESKTVMIANKILATLKDKIGQSIQIGGNETVGRGRVRLNWQVIQS